MAGPALSRRSTYFRYDVFINFRGKDTRHRFTGYLYHFLCKKGIRTFIDSEKLQFGENITPSLLMAIKDSRIAITVFSENYASSSFCLDELVHILDWIKGEDRFVLPVFYHVDPSDLRYHRGAWGEALDKHEERLKNDDGVERLNKWKMALQAAAGMNGTHLTKHGEIEEVKYVRHIIEEVQAKINRSHLRVECNDVITHMDHCLVQNDRSMDWDPMIDECQQVRYTGKRRFVSRNPSHGSNCLCGIISSVSSYCSDAL